jgi:CDGSH-type Zn-finger protein/uncharacterized Fe-S cluster protein YjdI
MSKIHRYEGARLTVLWDEDVCVHAAECLRHNHRVFNSRRRPWVEPDAASPDEVIAVIAKCPSGALGYEWRDAKPQPAAVAPADVGVATDQATSNQVKVVAHGPAMVLGRIELQAADGTVIQGEKFALCRCGGSSNKPFCDGSHKAIGFTDQGIVGSGKVKDAAQSDGLLRLRVLVNGPIVLDGTVEIKDAAGTTCLATGGASLCRCGASANKPFCDGAHKSCAFADEGLLPIS